MNSHISQYFLASETRTRPKSFCKIKRKDGHFGWGCLVDDAPDETSDWTKYFILTSSKAIPKENFDAKEYEVEFTKRRGKCCRLTDIAKTVHHILSGLVLIAIYPQSYEFNHAMFQTAPCFRRHKSCSVLEKSPRVDVARSESSSHFFFIDKELYDFQPNGNTSLKDGYKGCCSVLFELSNEDLKVQAVGIVNLEDNGQSSPILLPKSSLNTILDDENQTVEEEQRRQEEEERNSKKEVERRKVEEVEEEKNREQGTGTVTEEHITRVKVIPPCLSDAQREEFVKFFLLDVSLFAKNNRTSLDTGLHALIEHIQDVYNVCVGKLGIGCLEITVQCPTLDSLERLWSDTRSGCIDKFAEKFLVTSTFKTKLGVENMTLKVEIKEEDYKACRESFNPHLGNSVKVDSFIATVTSPFASTKEMTNYARLCRLLVNVGFQVLRSTFDNIHPPATLRTVLGSTSVHYATLQSLYVKGKEKVLNPMQWRKLYPTHSPVSSVTFDITLLTVLLRNICGLSPPATGWDRLPPAADICIADDIARVKYYRNSVYGHASQASIDDKSFNVYWQEIREALVRLGGARFRADIDKLKQDCMDPDMEKHYCKLMEKWKKDDDNIKEKLEEIEDTTKGSVEKIKGEMAKMDSEVAEVQKLSTLTLPAGESKDEGGIEDTVKETIKECSDRGGTSVSESNKELNQLHSAERDIYVTRKKSLLPYGFSVDSRDATGRTPLMKEAWNGDVQAVKGLIERGANPSLMDNRRWNSLHFAACGGDLDIISLIHSRVKDIESKEVEGYTPLMIAAFNGKLQAVKWFLEEGAAKTCVCNRGWNLLHCAALSGDPDVMGVILPHVPDIECKNANGQTPLIIAVRKGNLQSVKLLLERGANPFAKDNNGQDSLYYASSDDSNMFDFLLSHVGKSELTTGND
ncbi:uncharacterized protein LOC111344551 [Stylophora pistillata]|uniref:uncharacterized protein LOC111344551 n=1 Tax=Stylophora pistillata TaxID=50429 RepID=UPI000C0577F0|nr:uncharacterized protein LOC111344551 [Stylophora pistillata]